MHAWIVQWKYRKQNLGYLECYCTAKEDPIQICPADGKEVLILQNEILLMSATFGSQAIALNLITF